MVRGTAAALGWGGMAAQFWRYYNYFYALGCLAGCPFCFLQATRKNRVLRKIFG